MMDSEEDVWRTLYILDSKKEMFGFDKFFILYSKNSIKFSSTKSYHGFFMGKLLIKMESSLFIELLFNQLISSSSTTKTSGKLILLTGKCIQLKRI